MFHRLLNFFTSLRLTVVCLGLALALVFVGTLAQVKLGLYVAQEDYFRSLFVYWSPKGANWKIPILPGGWLLGGVLLVNLIAAHIKRFSLARKKIGIFLIHGGLIFLLLGQFLTEVFQIESNIRFEEGQTRNYTEDSRNNELAVIDISNPDRDEVVAIPQTLLAKKGEIRHPKLPFTIKVKNFFENSRLTGSMEGSADVMRASGGVGERLPFASAPKTTSMNDEDKPSAQVEIVSDKGTVGEWIVTTWLTKFPWQLNLHGIINANTNLPPETARSLHSLIETPQTFSFDGRTYQIALRPIRYYKPYNLTLLDFRHDLYAGTGIPQNFSSKVHLSDSRRGEERDVLIKMNNPLRYDGETFFQAGFDPENDRITVLQVVNNPAAITPYVACTLVGVGLLVQFLTHLVSFGRRTKNKDVGSQKNSWSNKPVAATAERRTS